MPGLLQVVNAGVLDTEGASANQGAVDPTADAAAVRYTPPAGFSGTDTFFYSAQDSVGKGCSAEVTVTVAAAPVPAALPTGGGASAADTATGRGTLPRTGSDSVAVLPLALLGAGFVGAGAVRRRSTSV